MFSESVSGDSHGQGKPTNHVLDTSVAGPSSTYLADSFKLSTQDIQKAEIAKTQQATSTSVVIAWHLYHYCRRLPCVSAYFACHHRHHHHAVLCHP